MFLFSEKFRVGEHGGKRCPNIVGEGTDPGVTLFLKSRLLPPKFSAGGGEIINALRKPGEFVVALQRNIIVHTPGMKHFHSLYYSNEIGEPLSQHGEEEYNKQEDRREDADAPDP